MGVHDWPEYALLGLGTTARVPWLDLPMTELLYKSFLLFYGLVFPLYLLLAKRPAYFWGALLVAVVPYSVGFLVGGDVLEALSVSMALVGGFVVVQLFSRV